MSRKFRRAFNRPLLFAAVLLTSGFDAARGGDVRWQTDLKAAAREAQRQQKPLLVEFTASWCRFCNKMKQTTFRDRDVIRHVNGCFVPVSVDADKHRELMEAVGVTGLPATVVISPKFEIMHKITGYLSPTDMSRHLGRLCPNPGAAARTDGTHSQVPAKLATAPEPPAFAGRCLVSMLDDRKLRSGSEKLVSHYRGRTLHFVSVDCKRKFDADPRKYWPAADGDCPVTLRENAVRIGGNPSFAAIFRARLWFFASNDQRQQFAKSPAKYAAAQTSKSK